ncbi:MAG: urease accessory protein UreF [Verrucomicrobia bacterium]|nr:urease accessory protein UreF [Verrucomicrobiota bacterium]MBV9673992.1 urease accessory protein UreF [Verrucomicrobiota bacterium]
MKSITQLAGLLQLASPSLPIGGFSYSQGLESAVEHGLIYNEATLMQWITDGLQAVIAVNDGPIMSALFQHWRNQKLDEVATLNEWFLATRESFELRQETEQMGWSLAQLALQMEWYDKKRRIYLEKIRPIGFPISFAFAAASFELGLAEAVCAYCCVWIESQVSAALKAVPIGQLIGQKIRFTVQRSLPTIVARILSQNEVSTFSPHLSILSARHEVQYSRLFRS